MPLKKNKVNLVSLVSLKKNTVKVQSLAKPVCLVKPVNLVKVVKLMKLAKKMMVLIKVIDVTLQRSVPS